MTTEEIREPANQEELYAAAKEVANANVALQESRQVAIAATADMLDEAKREPMDIEDFRKELDRSKEAGLVVVRNWERLAAATVNWLAVRPEGEK